MANLLDYLDWRGDLTLAQSPFNEVDNLILAELSFLDFGGIVPGPGQGKSVGLRTAADLFFQRFPAGEKIDMGVLVPDAIPDMLRKMAVSQRFRDMRLNCFTDILDEEQASQFAALTIETGDGLVYLSFRGTDDTLAGWKEDLHLACMPEVPSQKLALAYTQDVARRYPRRGLRLGGHSKGGNLAVYAGVYAPVAIQRRIAAIYSNDGPGFHQELLNLPEHSRVEDRIFSIVPKSSVVGMMLEHEEDYAVVDSTQVGLMQHDGFSWVVLGDRFVKLRSVTRRGHLHDLVLKEWVRGMSISQREKFVDGLFAVLTASGAATLTDLRADSFKAAGAMVRAMKDMEKDTRDALFYAIRLLFKSNFKVVLEELQGGSEPQKPPKKRVFQPKNKEEA